ncbi:hypothetical protein Amal_00364 [Acetobacter malorum]|uniref:Uncharacterized protein n=1 Tax=Acetobacter malorum TaxID=178901 RepID=A0A177GDN0_9PROT|nr:hypothetical protein Amal_00364 [Acetobacter malorum]
MPPGQHADKVHQAGPDDGYARLEGVSVDNRGHGVGRVMKTVNKFKNADQQKAGGQRQDGKHRIRSKMKHGNQYLCCTASH